MQLFKWMKGAWAEHVQAKLDKVRQRKDSMMNEELSRDRGIIVARKVMDVKGGEDSGV